MYDDDDNDTNVTVQLFNDRIVFSGLHLPDTAQGTGGTISDWDGIDLLNKEFTVSWATKDCANDVVIGPGPGGSGGGVIPEPTTMLLSGSGLIGLLALRNKFTK